MIRMNKIANAVCLGLSACLCAGAIGGCQASGKPFDPSNVRDIARLSTLECTYHNVAKIERAADAFFIPNFFNVGQKRGWFEYDATLEVGIDASKVSISEPDESGNVVVTVPKAEILTRPDINEDTMTDVLTDNGWMTDITDDERKEALNNTQQKVREKAESDEALKLQANERAKTLLEQYVKNAGKALGETYTVTFQDAE